MKDERVYLLHAIEAIDAILRYTVDGEQAFFSDAKTQDAVIRNIEIVGQAVKGACLVGGPMALDDTDLRPESASRLEPTEVNANRSARLPGGQISIDESV